MRSSFDTRRWPQAEGIDAHALTVGAAMAGSAIVGSVMSSSAQTDAASTAANAQVQASQAGIAEQQRQFNQVQTLLNPFVQAATGTPRPVSGGGFPAPRSTAPAAAMGMGSPAITAGSAPGFGGNAAPSGPWGTLPQIGLAAGVLGSDGSAYGTNFSQPGTYTTGGQQVVQNTGEWGGSSLVNAPQTTYTVPGDPNAGGAAYAGDPNAGGGGTTGGSLGAQQDILGLNGPDAQQAAINRLQTMPAFTSALTLGENRILQNASATGGLRGGNTQGALAYFAPSLLAQQINDYYGRLSGITSLGENAAALVGNAGVQTGQGVSGLLQQGGSAQAGAALAGGRAQSNLYGSLNGALGQYVGGGGSFGSGFSPGGVQGMFAQTSAGGSGFGTGLAYGNQDYGQYF